MFYVVCRAFVTRAWPAEQSAKTLLAQIERQKGCTMGGEHVVIEADSPEAARAAYDARVAVSA